MKFMAGIQRQQRIFTLLILVLLCMMVLGNPTPAQPPSEITFTEVATFGNGEVYSAFWTVDDSMILVNSSRGVRIYSPDFELLHHLKNIKQAVPSPTDDLLAGITRDDRVVLLSLDQPSQRIELPINDTPRRFFFSRDGNRLAVEGYEQIWLWDIGTETLLNHFERELQMFSLDWSPNNGQIALGGIEGVRICEVSTERCESLPVTSTGGNWGYLVSWGPDSNELAIAHSNSSNDSNTLEIWDVSTRQILRIFQAGDISILHWDWSENLITTGTRLSSFGYDVLIPPEVAVWEPSTGELITYIVMRDRIFSADWNQDHTQLLIADEGNLLSVLEVIPNKAIKSLSSIDEFMNTVTSLAWSPDGQMLASGSEDGRVRVWEIASGKVIDRSATRRGSIQTLAWNSHDPVGDTIVYGGSDFSVYTNYVENMENGRSIAEHSKYILDGIPGVLAIGINGKGIIASGGSDGDILIVKDIRPISLRTEGASVFDLEWMPDDERIVAANGSVTFWDSNTLSLLESLTCTDLGIISDVALNSSGDLLAGGAYPTCLWDLTSGEQLETLLNYGSPMAWKPDTTILAAKDFYNPTLLRLWDVDRAELVGMISVGTNISAIAWSPDGESIAIGDTDGFIHIYEQQP